MRNARAHKIQWSGSTVHSFLYRGWGKERYDVITLTTSKIYTHMTSNMGRLYKSYCQLVKSSLRLADFRSVYVAQFSV